MARLLVERDHWRCLREGRWKRHDGRRSLKMLISRWKELAEDVKKRGRWCCREGRVNKDEIEKDVIPRSK